jgi:DNA replicative helicase MCM subunit Mcm2 (Cdc46/Mcm family)
MKFKGPIRNVTAVAVECVKRVRWTLDCGHQVSQKKSTPVAKRAHCPVCGKKEQEGQHDAPQP